MATENNKDKRKTISFGRKGSLARSIVTDLEKKCGKTEVSNLIRKAVVAYFSTSKDFNNIKIKALLEERKQIRKQMMQLQNELDRTERDLSKLGHELEIGE